MITLARFILKGPSQAALVAASMAILGLVFMPALWLSAAAIALVVLVNGASQGARVMIYATVGSSLLGWLVLGRPEVAVAFATIAWLPAWLPAVVLYRTVSLALSLLLITGLATAGVLMFYSAMPGFESAYLKVISDVIGQLVAQYGLQLTEVETAEVTAMAVKLLPGLFISSMMFGAVAALLLARWWQSVIYHPGGFGEEFRALRLGRSSALIAVAVIIASVAIESDLVLAMVMLVFTLYLLQGTALLHAVVKGMKLNAVWLFVVYALIFFVPHVVAVMVMAGILDAWIDFRRRLIPESSGNEPPDKT